MDMINVMNKNSMEMDERFCIIHPLFDVPEEKFDADKIGPMKLTKSVKYSLMSLRVYLILMIGLAGFRTLVMAGVIK